MSEGAPSATGTERRAGAADALAEAIRAGDEAAFASLVDALSPSLLSVARMHVRDAAVAEEVVQETWMGVLRGIDRFEGRAALRTWIFQIMLNIARTRARKERRSLPFAALRRPSEESERALDDERFLPPTAAHEPGWWVVHPARWDSAEERVLAGETRDVVLSAIESLPPAQREVITLRDVQGWSAREACLALELSDGNQRVLLHRARTRVRAALEDHLAGDEG